MVEDLAREFHAQQIAAGVALALGRDVSVPAWSETREAFDVELATAPAGESVGRVSMSARGIELRALGLA